MYLHPIERGHIHIRIPSKDQELYDFHKLYKVIKKKKGS